jgi:hypothetical protein
MHHSAYARDPNHIFIAAVGSARVRSIAVNIM